MSPFLILLVAFSVFIGFGAVLDRQKRQQRQLNVIERNLERVMDHLGIVDPQPELAEVVRALEQGQKIQAVKRYRETTGSSLADAKADVERLARERGL